MHTFRKALIFLACLIVGALLINLGTAVGLSYGLSTIIFETVAFVLAYKLCDAYNKKHGIEKKRPSRGSVPNAAHRTKRPSWRAESAVPGGLVKAKNERGWCLYAKSETGGRSA